MVLEGWADGNLYVTDYSHHRVLRYKGATGAFLDVFIPAGSGGLSGPRGLAFGPDGMLYIANRNTADVRRYDGRTGAFVDIAIPTASGLDDPVELLVY